MRRSLYLGDTVYEVIAEPGFDVSHLTRIISESVSPLCDNIVGRSPCICRSRSSHVRDQHSGYRAPMLQ